MSGNWPDGEGPVDDIEQAKKRAKAEQQKPEHQYRVTGPQQLHDPRDRADYDLEDPGRQEKDDD